MQSQHSQYKCTIAMCKPKEIKSLAHIKFGHRFTNELEYSCATYRQNAVTIRKCHKYQPETVRLAEEAIEKDYAILKR